MDLSMQNLSELWRGHYPLFCFMAILVFGVRTVRLKTLPGERFLLAALVLHSGMLLLYFAYVDRGFAGRYFISSVPLYIGWTAIGWRFLYRKVYQWAPWKKGRLPKTLLALSVFGIAWDGMLEARHTYDEENRAERRAMLACAEWLRTDGAARVPEDYPRLESTLFRYQSGRLPIVITNHPEITYYAKADNAPPLRRSNLTVARVVEHCIRYHVNYIVLDAEDLRRNALGFLLEHPLHGSKFSVVFDEFKDGEFPVVVVGFEPLLTGSN